MSRAHLVFLKSDIVVAGVVALLLRCSSSSLPMPPTTTVALATPPPPGLAEATKNSTTAWQHHLAELFRTAKDRFPDVVWELTPEDDADKVADEVWGHKGLLLFLACH
jgi:hypothetical protein